MAAIGSGEYGRRFRSGKTDEPKDTTVWMRAAPLMPKRCDGARFEVAIAVRTPELAERLGDSKRQDDPEP